MPSATKKDLTGVWGSGKNDVYVVGAAGTILHTADGKTWQPLDAKTSENLQGVWGSGAKRVFIVGSNGTVLRSADQGSTWSSVNTGSNEDLVGIFGLDTSELYIVGHMGTILHSTDDGVTWQKQTSGTSLYLFGVWASSSTNVFVGGDKGTILHSVDHGATWTAQANPDQTLIPGKATSYIRGFWGSSATDVWAVGYPYATGMLHSTDAGSTWTATKITGYPWGWEAMWAASATELYFAGHDGDVRGTLDSGATWYPQNTGTTVNLFGIWGSGPSDIYAVGALGTIIHNP
jgi:photosystem II stability/assembly factor-like uncharacterized protein